MELFGSGSRRLKQSISSPSGFLMAVVGLTAGSLLVAATIEPGPGLGAYLPWAAALVQGIPDPLVSNTRTLSPTGFPLLHWYPGTGLFLSLPTLLTGGAVSVERGARLAAAASIVLTLAASSSLLCRIARERVGLLLFGMSLLLVATNTGYYIRLLGSELFAFAVVALMIWLAWSPREIRKLELAGVNALAMLLMTVRPQSILMALPAIILGLLRWAEARPRPRLTQAVFYFGAPLLLGLLIVLQFNEWMTGDWTVSPLYKANNDFKALDPSGPYLGLVLFDPRAGALRYTPLIAIGLGASLVPILDRGLGTPYRAFYLVSILVSLAQIWIISGFYAWSGGMRGFGSRYLNLLSLYGVMAIVHILASERVTRALKGVIFGAALACAAYSAALLVPRLALLGSLVIGMSLAWVIIRKRGSHHGGPDAVYGIVGLSLLLPLSTYYVWVLRNARPGALPSGPTMALMCGATVLVVAAVYLLGRDSPNFAIAATSLAVVSVVTLAIEFSLIARLHVGAAAFRARELASPSPHFLYRNRFDMLNLEGDLASPEEVYKWPANVRSAIKALLEEEKRRTAIRR